MNLNLLTRILQQLVSLPNGGTFIILSDQPHIPRANSSCFARETAVGAAELISTEVDLDSVHRQSSVWFLYATRITHSCASIGFFRLFSWHDFLERFSREERAYPRVWNTSRIETRVLEARCNGLEQIGDVTAGADLGEKKSWCLRQVVSFCARGTWSQRDLALGIARAKDFAKARTLVAKVTLCKFHLVFRTTLKRCAASKCLLKRALVLLPFLCSSVTSVKNRKLRRKGVEAKGQAKRARGKRACL